MIIKDAVPKLKAHEINLFVQCAYAVIQGDYKDFKIVGTIRRIKGKWVYKDSKGVSIDRDSSRLHLCDKNDIHIGW